MKQSAGIVVFRRRDDDVIEVLIGHLGGPYWAGKDLHGWSIPKGEPEDGEDAFSTARREFEEETGQSAPTGDYLALRQVRQRNGKIVTAFAVESDLDAQSAKSNMFSMEWPRGSGTMQEFPEIDRFSWFTLDEARERLIVGQEGLLDSLQELIGYAQPSPAS